MSTADVSVVEGCLEGVGGAPDTDEGRGDDLVEVETLKDRD